MIGFEPQASGVCSHQKETRSSESPESGFLLKKKKLGNMFAKIVSFRVFLFDPKSHTPRRFSRYILGFDLPKSQYIYETSLWRQRLFGFLLIFLFWFVWKIWCEHNEQKQCFHVDFGNIFYYYYWKKNITITIFFLGGSSAAQLLVLTCFVSEFVLLTPGPWWAKDLQRGGWHRTNQRHAFAAGHCMACILVPWKPCPAVPLDPPPPPPGGFL